MVDFSRESDLFHFITNFIIAEILFFIGSAILVTIKVVLSINTIELMEGSFLAPASQALFTEALSSQQRNWIVQNLFTWPINVFLVIYNSLLLTIGVAAILVLIPLNIGLFEGQNAIPAEAIPFGFLFLFCWGILPFSYMTRSSIINFGVKIKNIFYKSQNS